jgi:uncharacterized SAM-binding protein YcdF (DUF218 family)
MFKSIYNWLVRADSPATTDLIFVLAGLQSRKVHALELFRRHLAPQILFSVGRFEIRRFVTLDLPQEIDLLKIMKDVPPQQRHLFVSLSNREFQVHRMSIGPLGTLREIEALRQWLRPRPQIGSLLIVSSETHLRRLRLCCRALLPPSVRVHFAAVQEENSQLNRDNWWRAKETRKIVLFEVIKILCYSVLLPIHKLAVRRSSLSLPFISGKGP